MARKIRKAKRIVVRKRRKIERSILRTKSQSNFFSKIQTAESYTSLVLGAIVVLILGILFISFAKVNRNNQTSSVKNFMSAEKLNLPDSNTSSTYTVRPGDDLWTISANIYNDGYKWVEIAKLNNIENPEQLEAGEKLSLLEGISEKEDVIVEPKAQKTPKMIFVSSITEDTYTVVRGDNLWNISVRAYGDGFKWVEIARANNLQNPNLIHPGNQFIIPR